MLCCGIILSMYEFSEKENKTVNQLFYLTLIYIVLGIIRHIDWYGIVIKATPRSSEAFSTAVNVMGVCILISRSILMIVIFILVKKLRETRGTKRLYAAVFWILMASAIFSYLYMGVFYFANFLSPDIIRVIRDKNQLISVINTVYLYSGLLLPVPFYIAILIKEKLDINWMAAGSLANIHLFLLEKIIYGLRDYMRSDIRYMVDFSFEQRLPLLSVYINYDALIAIRGYFWAVGVLAIVLIYKKRFKEYGKNKALDSV